MNAEGLKSRRASRAAEAFDEAATAAAVEVLGDEIQKLLVGKPVLISFGAGLSIAVAAAKELKLKKERVLSLLSGMWDAEA